MNKQITFQQYRSIDLTILAVLLAVSQGLIYIASRFWFPDQLYVVSTVAALTALVMMRWGGYAAIHAVLGGLLFTWLAGGDAKQYLIYGAGNLASMLALLMFKLFGKERIRQNIVLTLAFALSVQLLMLLGRAGVAAVLGYPADACLGFITTDLLSALFTMVIIGVARRVAGLFEDQKNYLLRIERERQLEGRDQF